MVGPASGKPGKVRGLLGREIDEDRKRGYSIKAQAVWLDAGYTFASNQLLNRTTQTLDSGVGPYTVFGPRMRFPGLSGWWEPKPHRDSPELAGDGGFGGVLPGLGRCRGGGKGRGRENDNRKSNHPANENKKSLPVLPRRPPLFNPNTTAAHQAPWMIPVTPMSTR